VLLCLGAGAVYSGALYISDRLNEYFSRPLIFLLAVLRFTVVSVLAFFLLNPMLKSSSREVGKPIVAVAVDNSESLAAEGSDLNWADVLKTLPSSLGDDFDVRFFTFGKQPTESNEALDLDFSETSTSMSALYEELFDRFSNQNLGAVILASDGIYNRGQSPEFMADKLRAPTYALALGDTTPKRDAMISDVLFNKISFLGNRFPLRIELKANLLKGKNSVLVVSQAGKELFRQDIGYNNEAWETTVSGYVEATKPGTQRYDIELIPLEGERTEVNNRRSIFVEVLDSRQKILLLAACPHPDLRAIQSALDKSDNHELITALADDFSGNLKDFGLVIFHNLPASGGKGTKWLTEAVEKGVPQLFITGPSTSFDALNNAKTGIKTTAVAGSITNAGAKFNDGFSLFVTDSDMQRQINRFPPLQAPFGDVELSNSFIPLAFQRVGNIATKVPLMALDNQSAVRRGFIGGEGLWRWRLFNYMDTKSHEQFDQLMGKMVRFLAAKEDKSRFRVEVNNQFEDNQEIVFKAQLFNDAFELTNAPEVQLVVKDEQDREFNYTLSRSGDSYFLNIGRLPEGNYTYSAKTTFNAIALSKTGSFSVSRLSIELNNLVADHGLLYRLAENTGGRFVQASEADRLADLIKSNTDISSVSYEKRELTDLINLWWILVLLVLFLGGEWLLRKWSGAY
jgi:hypothetical protein